MQLFEELYGMLALLYPDMRGGRLHGAASELDVTVVDHSQYTTTLALSRGFGQPLLPDLSMTVRVYHDARVAEVVAYQGCDRLPAPYAAQGDSRFVRDERRQINCLLRQLLWRRIAGVTPYWNPSPEPDPV